MHNESDKPLHRPKLKLLFVQVNIRSRRSDPGKMMAFPASLSYFAIPLDQVKMHS